MRHRSQSPRGTTASSPASERIINRALPLGGSSLLGRYEADLPDDVRVGRRGAEQMELTEDYRLGRSTVELDDDGDGFRVTAVTVELPDGPETFHLTPG